MRHEMHARYFQLLDYPPSRSTRTISRPSSPGQFVRDDLLSMQRYRTVVVGISVLCGFFLASPAFGVDTIGTHYPSSIPTPQGYSGSTEPVIAWSHVLTHPNATYIAVHFTGFDLAPNDRLVITDREGGQEYTLTDQGRMGAGTFWARHIKGDTAVLKLIVVNESGGQGFLIDEYVAGDVASGGTAAICIPDDRENAICYEDTHPTEYARGRAVARLLVGGSGSCTGFLVSSSGHLLTNDHCFYGGPTTALVQSTDVEFMAEAPNCNDANFTSGYPGVMFDGEALISFSGDLDYALIKVRDNPSASYGYIKTEDRAAELGEPIYIPQHPRGRAKELGIYSTDSSDPAGVCSVFSVDEPGCEQRPGPDLGYYCESEKGSSGSPVLVRSSHKAIALHHCGSCPNRGVPMEAIYPLISNDIAPPDLEVTLGDGFSSKRLADGTFSPPSKTYTLENFAAVPITYSVAKNQDWVTLDNTDGTLQPGAAATVTVSFNAIASSLPVGIYSDMVSIANLTTTGGRDTVHPIELQVGELAVKYDWTMASDPGWVEEPDTSSWAFGQPTGGGGGTFLLNGGPDPTSGATGVNVYGYNLDGNYERNLTVAQHLTTSAIDCWGLSSVTLRFQRWLGVEGFLNAQGVPRDTASLSVSVDNATWHPIWMALENIADTTWSLQEVDISAWADGETTVYLRWTLGPTNNFNSYCGWNIDDVQVFGFEARSCAVAADCDDGDGCNGVEDCVYGICQPGAPLLCSDPGGCTADCNNNNVPDECEGPIVFVDADATGAGNGRSWADAYVDLQDALALAANTCVAVSEIWVAEGTYRPDLGVGIIGGDQNATFELVSGVKIYGGFAGGEVGLRECVGGGARGACSNDADCPGGMCVAVRDFVANETVLSGDLSNNDLPGFGNRTENSYNVVAGIGTDPELTALDGFTISGGSDTATAGDAGGGGIRLEGDGSGDNFGTTIRNCTISDNSAALYGGGIACMGAGTDTCDARIVKSLIEGNTAQAGGGIAAKLTGGAFGIVNSRVLANDASVGGGGVYIWNGRAAEVVNSLVARNTTAGSGKAAGIWVQEDDSGFQQLKPTITNCTIVDNDAGLLTGQGGGLYIEGAPDTTTINNSILWGNKALSGAQIDNSLGSGTVVVQYSNVRQLDGTGDFVGDVSFDAGSLGSVAGDAPEFVHPAIYDYRLKNLDTSPSVDAGSEALMALDPDDVNEDGDLGEKSPLDLAGRSRRLDGLTIVDCPWGGCGTAPFVDMGAYEAGCVSTIDCNGNGVDDCVDTAGTVPDCNGNSVPDECDLSAGPMEFLVDGELSSGGNPWRVEMGHLNNDAHLDLAAVDQGIGGAVIVYFGIGDGTFGPGFNVLSVDYPLDVEIGDFDGGTGLDLAVIVSTAVYILLNDGNGTFTLSGSYPAGIGAFSIATGDFDGDNRIDVATANMNDGDLSVLFNNGNGTFTPTPDIAVGRYPTSITTGDFDRIDGPDLAVANGDGTVSVLLNTGNGTFAAGVTYSVGGWPDVADAVAAGDLNRDGATDLVVAKSGSGTVSVLLNVGNGTFSPHVPYALPSWPGYHHGLAIADYNGDLYADVVVTNPNGNSVSVLANTGLGTFLDQVPFSLGSGDYGPIGIAVGNFDGVGGPDLATANSAAGTISVLLNQTIPPASIDRNLSAVPDECEGFLGTPGKPSRTAGHDKMRFISFVPGTSYTQRAMRVEIMGLPPSEYEPPSPSPFVGTVLWVGEPVEISEGGGRGLSNPCTPSNPCTGETFWAAQLECHDPDLQPYFTEWTQYDVVHVFSESIVPGYGIGGTENDNEVATYEIRSIPEGVDLTVETNYSQPLTVSTARWGDITSGTAPGACTFDEVGSLDLWCPPDGVVTIIDQTAMLDAYGGHPGSPLKARADMLGVTTGPASLLDLKITVSDITAYLGAISGTHFIFTDDLLTCPADLDPPPPPPPPPDEE